MTSEGPHRPGQEPDEVSPDAGGPSPYGDRTAQQDNGYGRAAPDLGWAPPPPAGRPNPPAPAWGPPNDAPPAAGWGAAQVPQQAEPAQPGQWGPPNGAPQSGWSAPHEQPGDTWAAAPQDEQPRPSWVQQAEQAAPAWAQAPEAGVRGAATVPAPVGQQQDAWAGQDDPARSGGWNAPAGQDDPAGSGGWNASAQQQDDAARSGGWNTSAQQQDDAARSGGWNAGDRSPQDDPARSGGWNTGDASGQAGQPAWAQRAEQAAPDWAQAPEAGARGAARVPAPAPQQQDAWAGQDDPARSGGWNATPQQQDDADRSGGWHATGAPQQQDEPARSGGWNAGAPRQDERPQQPAWASPDDQPSTDWNAPGDQRPADGWEPQQSDPRQGREWPAQDEPANGGAWGAASGSAQQHDRPEVPGWAGTDPNSAPPVRAAAAVPTGDGPPAWGTGTGHPQPRAGADRPAVPDAEPWAPEEVWGRAEAASSRPGADSWEPGRPEEASVYQPAPAPGISPANALPLPPQEQRVPGASLASAPPADYVPPAQFAPEQPAYAEQSARESGGPQGYEPAQGGADAGWGTAEPQHAEPRPPAAPLVPGPRTSPESGVAARASVPQPEAAEAGAAGSISASASVPLASRVMPPTDQALRPGGSPAPQPRVYGRPSRPEPEPEHNFHPDHDRQPPGYDDHDPSPRFDEQGALPRFEDHGAPSHFDEHGPSRFDEQGAPPRFDEQGAPPQFDEQGAPPQFDEQGGPSRFDEQGAAPRFDQQGAPPRFDEHGAPPRFDDHDRQPAAQHGFGEAGPSSPAGPPPFPPGVPSFMDPAGNTRPVNGVRPHGATDQAADPFSGPGGPGGGAGNGMGQGYGPAPMGQQAHGGFPPAFPPAPQQSGPGWGPEPDQGRFEAFKPEAEPKAEPPTPKVRNGWVLAVVLVTAVLILTVPLGLLALLGKMGGSDSPRPFDPAVGSCVKQANGTPVEADCGEADAFFVVSKVNAKENCADQAQPHVVLPGDGTNRVLCLRPAK